MEMSLTTDQQDISVQTVRPLVESFFMKMTAKQWNLLMSGRPDDATKVQLAELLINIISTVSTALVKVLGLESNSESEECVWKSLGDSLRQSFSQGSSKRCDSLDQLTDLIEKEVRESVNSGLRNSAASGDPEMNHFTEPNKLQKMISCTCRVLKTFAANIKSLFKPRPRKQRRLTTPPQAQDRSVSPKTQLDSDLSSVTSEDSMAFTEESETIKVSSDGSVDSQKSKIVKNEIDKEMRDVLEPLLDDVPDPDYNMLQSEVSSEIKDVADEIAQLITDEFIIDRELSGEVGQKIKNLFEKNFAKASILKILIEVQNKFQKETKVQDRQAIKSLVSILDSLLKEQKQNSGSDKTRQSFNKLSRTNIVEFTQEFADLLFKHTTAGWIPDTVMTPDTVVTPDTVMTSDEETTPCVRESQKSMYRDIKNKVSQFLTLLRWWINNQVASHRDRVTLALMGNETLATTEASAGNVVEEAKAQTEKRTKMYVNVLVDQVVTTIYAKAKVTCTSSNTLYLTQQLFEKIWAEVKDISVDTPSKSFRNLDKAVFQDLSKRWSCPVKLLVSIRLGEPEVEKCIACSIRSRLYKKPSAICRFFSSMRKGFCNCFS
ncbi:Hypothetical protein SMAX5B_007496 [Scophthalmus maximus]|uniref:Uncharacterized protein n=1 Tax=Scophthalmus maximus TaxID=52904 RepID=A0A2U9BRC1_SCOMX|nr:Hypothetical protein SMAX5B_007496 [Scophthalmus maximus]